MDLGNLWRVLPDSERRQWALDPFTSVGPLQFGMSPDEVAVALDDMVTARSRDASSNITSDVYSKVGVTLYYDSGEQLHGVSADALRGPQVFIDGIALVGRIPSELEQWLCERADSREPFTELVYMPSADPASLSLGVVACVQRAGDRLVTRPVFLPADAMEDIHHQLPQEAWAI